jgi:hypothetical protein
MNTSKDPRLPSRLRGAWRRACLSSWVFAALLLLAPVGALAAPVTYDLTSGQITTIQFLDPSGAAVPCPIGFPSNCLTNAPVAIDSGTIVLDQGALVLANLDFHSTGPSLINFGGAIGLDSMAMANATFQTSGASPLTPDPVFANTFAFGPAAGTLTSDLTVTPAGGGGPSFFPSYQIASAPTGSIFVSSTTANLSLAGVDLGTFCNPLDPSSCLVVKADFNLLATRRTGPVIPEPGAFLVFAVGTLLVHTSVRRRRAVLSR